MSDCKDYLETENLCPSQPLEYDKLYITTLKPPACRAGFYRLYFFRIFKLPLVWFRYAYDGPVSFFSTWNLVGLVDTTREIRKHVIVTDTLNIYCRNPDDYEKVIPYISGNYSRLSICGGFITLDQVKRLIHPDVKRVQLLAEICVRNPNDDENLVQYITQFLTSPDHRFAFRRHEYFQAVQKQQLKDTFTDHSHCPYFLGRVIFLVDRRSADLYFYSFAALISICLFGACICPLFPLLRIPGYVFIFSEVFLIFFAIFIFLVMAGLDVCKADRTDLQTKTPGPKRLETGSA